MWLIEAAYERKDDLATLAESLSPTVIGTIFGAFDARLFATYQTDGEPLADDPRVMPLPIAEVA